jgi:hypothetical protein
MINSDVSEINDRGLFQRNIPTVAWREREVAKIIWYDSRYSASDLNQIYSECISDTVLICQPTQWHVNIFQLYLCEINWLAQSKARLRDYNDYNNS